jgi:hypothetical protein
MRISDANKNEMETCKGAIDRMLVKAQTKVIIPILTLSLVREYCNTGVSTFFDAMVRKNYQFAVLYMKEILGHDLHIIDDTSKEVKDYLIDMKVQSIVKAYLLKLTRQFEDVEDREKVLQIVYDKFRREYSSAIS